jgi:signal transduction histidine kinase
MGNFKRLLFIFIAIFLFLQIYTGCKKHAQKPNSYDFIYKSYKQIPGVTEEEIEAIEAVRDLRGSFIYAMNYSTETFIKNDGRLGGYSVLFCQWLSALFGIRFVPRIMEWDELIAGLNAGTIDFTGELTATDERQKTFFMTGAIAERSIKIMQHVKSEPISFISQSRPVVYAFLEGSTAFEMVSPYITGEYRSVFVNDYEKAYIAMENGSIDAFFEDSTAEAAFSIYGDIVVEDFFPLIYGPVSLATRKDMLAPFISVVDKALNDGAVFHLTKLYNHGYRDYQQHRLFTQLSPEEIAFIRAHSVPENPIKIAAEYDNYPVSFYNVHDKEWQGISFDVLREISECTGLQFVIAHDENLDWSELLQMLEDGKIPMNTELLKVENRVGRYLWADEPYQQDNYALISAAEYPDLNVNEVLYSRVGLIKNTGYTEMFMQWFPRHTNTVEYLDNIVALKGLDEGEVDLGMATRNQLLAIVNYLELPGFKTNILFNHPSDSYFGFNLGEETLRSVISKAQKLVDTDEIFSRWNHRVFDYRRKMAQAQRPWLIGASALLLCVLSLVAMMLRRYFREGKRLEVLVRERTKELEVATKAAQAASHTKSEFLANMSHEIRTPINAVTGMTAIARNSSDINRIHDCLDKISLASHQLLELINDILDMSKIEAKKLELAHEPFDLRAMANNVNNIMSIRTSEKKQKFIVYLAPDLPDVVIGDEMRFSQILLNLLSNANKFTPDEGEINLSIRKTGDIGSKERIEAIVKDNGIGITEEQLSRLFNPFVQADSGTAKRFGGTGLGLAICKNIAELMGGTITARSTPGSGSVFTVIVLLEKGSCELIKPQEQKQPSDYNFKNHTLLLTEDIPINREIVIALLEDTGVTIECAENGHIAVKKYTSEPEKYDMIFMDIQMPVMDGYDASMAIRKFEKKMKEEGKLKKHPDGIPIIAMTANAFAEDVANCLKAGMNSHISKPIEVEAMLSIADKYLGVK